MCHDEVPVEEAQDHDEGKHDNCQHGEYKHPACSLRLALLTLHCCSLNKMSDLSALVQLFHIPG